ncbi:MAG TPA: DinB family protein [Acidobacteriota bacterium]|jgi:hypothetical protein
MDQVLQPLIDMNEFAWEHFKDDLKDMTTEEVNWRLVPESNSINVIVRHLRIEAQWHLASLAHGEPMPIEISATDQQLIDSVPLDFDRNLKELEELYTRFITALRVTTVAGLQERTAIAYAAWARQPAHFLGFHQLLHLTMHWGQIRTIRNLYRKTRGEPGRFFPYNPTISAKTL